jgi:glycerol-3-phosphate acyltransferase PlsY
MLKRKFLLAAACLLCAYLTFRDPYGLSGSEFSGGTVTGRLLELNFSGFFVFAAALLVVFVFPRVAAVAAVAASILCFPLCLYFVAPGFFHWIFKGPWKVPLRSYFVADRWALENVVALMLAAVVSIYVLRSHTKTNFSGRFGESTATPHA